MVLNITNQQQLGESGTSRERGPGSVEGKDFRDPQALFRLFQTQTLPAHPRLRQECGGGLCSSLCQRQNLGLVGHPASQECCPRSLQDLFWVMVMTPDIAICQPTAPCLLLPALVSPPAAGSRSTAGRVEFFFQGKSSGGMRPSLTLVPTWHFYGSGLQRPNDVGVSLCVRTLC